MSDAPGFKDMTVGSGVISAAQQAETFASLRTMPSFRFLDATLTMSRVGVQYATIERGADRFLQRLRRTGWLEYKRGRWVWFGAIAP